MRILIYDNQYNLLTMLINSVSSSDFNNLSYKNKVNDVGDASFLVRIDNKKITQTTIKHYNRVEITEEDGTVKWTGMIIEKAVQLNVIQVKCYSLAHILDKRITGSAVTYNGQADVAITSILTTMNAVEATGIIAGDIDLATAINMKFNYTKILSAVKSIKDAVNGQMLINNDRSLDFKSVVGRDLTASVIFRFEKSNPELANILDFKVSDVGRDIISKTYGKSDSLSTAQENATLKGLYGLLETFENFMGINDQTTLDNIAIHNNNDSQLSPSIDLSPSVPDNFEAGDIIAIKLNNGFTVIDGNYQVMEKSVKVINSQKLITIRINENTATFTDDIKKIKDNLDLLNTSI